MVEQVLRRLVGVRRGYSLHVPGRWTGMPSLISAVCVLTGVLMSAPAWAAGPPTLGSGGEYVTEVASDSATVTAEIDPGGTNTSYRFEYGPTSKYGQAAPVPDGGAGEGTVDTVVSIHIQDLTQLTTYHYRVVVRNELGTEAGPDQMFVTRPSGSEFLLPDNREWELVSPMNKHGAGIEPMSKEGSVIQAAERGDAIAYAVNAPLPTATGEPEGNRSVEATQILSQRSVAGWKTDDIQTPRNPTVSKFFRAGRLSQYLLFSSDLTLGLLEPEAETPLPPLPAGAEESVYLRHNATGEYEPLVTAGNVFEGLSAHFGKQRGLNAGLNEGVAAVGATPDLSHVALVSVEVPLVEGAGAPALYEWAGGQLQVASVLPASQGATVSRGRLGRENLVVAHAMSNDGSRMIWEGKHEEIPHLYLRDLAKEETVQVSPGSEAKFQTASDDGSKVFFTEEGELLVFTITSKSGPLSGTLTNLTGPAEVQGSVIGASDDGSSVYFIAKGVLTEVENDRHEKAIASADNLYVEQYDSESEKWQVKLIAVLSGADSPDWAEGAETNRGLLSARVSPDGAYLAFMSREPLTGYNNRDAVSGEKDEEVFLYSARTGRVVCPSCDPSNALPAGVADPAGTVAGGGLLIDHPGVWKAHWLAGSIPGWTPLTLSNAVYQSRYLTDDGRLFFDSADALVSADVNGVEDVYEYEPVGVANCSEVTASQSQVFSAASDGCVGLVSSGSVAQESAFLDASASGSDVFFLTTAQLSMKDSDSAFDVYDAHACSSASPCIAAPLETTEACNTVDSCRGMPSAQPSIFETSPTATFFGPGNVVRPVAKSQATQSRQKLAAALKACRRKRKRRHQCEVRTRKMYSSIASAQKVAGRRGK